MTKECFAIIIGSILGDGYLTKHYNQQNKSQLWLKYDDKLLNYLKWLHLKLASIGVENIRPKKDYHQHQFRTRPSYQLWELRKLFYPDDKKIIPDKIIDFLKNPISIAIWYMDDGNLDYRKKYHCNASFATYNFSKNDCEKLKTAMKINFKIKTCIHKSTMRKKVYFRLYVPSESMKNFIGLVSPYIHSCLKYKIEI